jgi:uncharacterized protein (TIGR03435 family)
LLWFAAWTVQGQPAWKEFSIGAAEKGGNSFGQYGIRAARITIRKALSRAYDMPEHRILGPGWIDTERYAIVAQVDDPKDFQPLFQQELANRFHLLAHRETRDVAVYVLKPGEGPPKLSQPEGKAGKATAGGQGVRMNGSVAEFANNLADLILRPVFDETAMDGRFEISLTWNGTANLSKAVKEQLGLQLVEERRRVELLIVDHMEKPQAGQ